MTMSWFVLYFNSLFFKDFWYNIVFFFHRPKTDAVKPFYNFYSTPAFRVTYHGRSADFTGFVSILVSV